MNKLKELTKKRGLFIVLIVLAIAIVGFLGTYAVFFWRSTDNTEINLKIGNYADVVFPLGQEINTNNLAPVFNYTDGEQLTFSIKNNDQSNAMIRYTVNFNITNIDSALANTSLKYKLVSGNNVLAEGNFNNATSNSSIELKKGMLSSGTTNFTFYLYIDGNIENDVSMMNKNISGNIEVTAEELHPFNLAQHITNLYTNAPKTEVTNNSITYNYATSVDLMNDRLGGTTASLDGGNIRYYGADITYLENSTGADGQREVGNWESLLGNEAPFKDSNGCNSYMQTSGVTDEAIAQYTQSQYSTISEFCSTTTRYYKAIKNYVDIGDRTSDDKVILWRIIGVFDGKLRIRRDESIGYYSYDTSASDVNAGYGINEWSQADIMKLLNPGYSNNQDYDSDGETLIVVNNSLYWDSGSGNCYNGSSYSNTTCDFTNSGLSDEAKEYVINQTLYLGGFDTPYTTTFANEAYILERGNNVVIPGTSCSGYLCNDNITRTTSWTGKVGLIYPSDFGYAADLSDSNCQGYLNNTEYNCTSNWMAQGLTWTVSPWTIYAYQNISIEHGRTYLGNDGISYGAGGWPTLLLDSSVMALGTGSKDDPYVLQ